MRKIIDHEHHALRRLGEVVFIDDVESIEH